VTLHPSWGVQRHAMIPPAGSIIGLGGSGRPWVRGQSCKLTGRVAAIHGESFPPDASGPRA